MPVPALGCPVSVKTHAEMKAFQPFLLLQASASALEVPCSFSSWVITTLAWVLPRNPWAVPNKSR